MNLKMQKERWKSLEKGHIHPCRSELIPHPLPQHEQRVNYTYHLKPSFQD